MKVNNKQEYQQVHNNGEYRLVLGKAQKALDLKKLKINRRVERVKPAVPTIDPMRVIRSLKSTNGAKELIQQIPNLAKLAYWFPTANFSVCQKTGTAVFLDIWDADHFDGFTDMQHNLADCRAWFSADGFTFWDSAETKTGRINCYFKAPIDGNYVCNVELQSYNGPAMVECLIDSFSYGPLPVNGSIIQPHPASLVDGYHSFRIRQMSGSFFFVSLNVWRVQ
jgi:hypothetical protein